MDKSRRKRKLYRDGDDLIRRMLFPPPIDSEEYKQLTIEMQQRSKSYGKSKNEVEVIEVKEVSDNSDFQKHVISMLNQILEKQNELEKNINRIFR